MTDAAGQIDLNLTYLEQLDSGFDDVDRDDALEQFLDGTFDLGVALRLDAGAVPPEARREYAERVAEVVDRFHHRVELYVDQTVRKFRPAFEADEWQQLCRRRSSLAFLQELTQGTPYGTRAMTIDLNELDDLILDVGEREGYLDPSKVPAGVPAQHWWWWYPDAAPADR